MQNQDLFIFSNLAISLDGKIASKERSFVALGSKEDRLEMQKLRKKADAVLMGASSLRSYAEPCTVQGAKKQALQVLLSSRLRQISENSAFFKDQSLKRLLYVGNETARRQIKIFEKNSEIVLLKKASKNKPIALQIVNDLNNRGIKKLLIEGGGTVMWEFIRAKLINELYVTLTPQILGGKDAPTLVDGGGFLANKALKLKLLSLRRSKDELYLHYACT